MEQEKYKNIKKGERGAIISIVAYLVLSAIKLFVGNMTGSEALQADGLNNATDIIASVAVLIGLKVSRKPADKDHPYGHWKAETVASMVASIIMFAVGLQVLREAITSIANNNHASPDLISAWTGLFCAVVMYFVYRYNRNLGRKIKSQAVQAAAKDNLSDAWVSVGTAIGIIGSQFNLSWLDPVTAVAVGLLICKTGYDIFREASHDLTDGFNEEKLEIYKEAILEIKGVKDVRNIRGRKYGNNAVVDVVITVNSDMAIGAAHDISEQVEDELKEKHHVYEVHVHVEPN
ncbi:MAG TPA: cation diffusion facilitator family transporter [Bacillaceae bacterium]|nr:cation diffusion facilitator family transporter [Paenibacillus bovis]HLU24052.1 cation diffusion facilitator family transporter [Bacillaceae bacterium]